MILLLDNYDSFTYNLAHLLAAEGAEVRVVRNDELDDREAERLCPSHLVISPGPGRPGASGHMPAILRRLCSRVPTLGVCLGHQAIVEAFGGSIGPARRLVHGKDSTIAHDGRGLFRGLPVPMRGGRYHSLAAERIPDELEVSARAEDGEVMGVRHRDLPVHGVQFHPESVLTPHGPAIVRNFLEGSGGSSAARRSRADEAAALRGGPRRSERSARIDDEREGSMIGEAIQRLLEGQDLSRGEAREVMDQIMRGDATPAQIAGYLVALRSKGETVAEIAGSAEAMRSHALPVSPTREDVIDTAGTGGDGAGTLNLSTAAALVAAAAGAAVAKHGNRAVSSACGSADVLEALGFDIELDPHTIARSIDELGFGFLYAPLHHPAMRHAGPVRRELATRTVFNVLGPLTNPAGARGQVVGVFAEDLAGSVAEALSILGTRRAFVVHGAGGIDELSPAGPNLVYEVVDGDIRRTVVDPDELGLPRCDASALRGGTPDHNAAAIGNVLAGTPGPARDAILLNAAYALVVAGRVEDPREGLELGGRAIDTGAAAERLDALVAFSRAERAEAS